MPSFWPWRSKSSYVKATEAKGEDETAAEYTCDEHLMSLAELASRHDTRINLDTPPLSLGLSAAEAATRLRIHGKNQLAQQQGQQSPPMQCPGSAPAPPQGAPGGPVQLSTPRVGPGH